MTINKPELDILITKVDEAFMRASSMAATFKCDADPSAMKAALKRGRLLKAAFELCFCFPRESDFKVVRKLCKNATEQLARHGLRAADLLAALQARIAAGLRMDRM